MWGKFHLLRIKFTFCSQGDSGGPLYMRYVIEDQKKSAYHDNSKPWYLLGIVSFGSKRCGVGYPAIYTRYKNIKHIKRIITCNLQGGIVYSLDSREY